VSSNTPVGWLGLGAMGMPMAQRLVDAGYRLMLWARRREAAQPLLEQGALWAPDLASLGRQCRQVFTMLRSTEDVLEVHSALAPHLGSGSDLIDLTTAGPVAADRLAPLMAQHGLHWLDSPVTGGVRGARQGQLTLFVGGEEPVLERLKPLLAPLAGQISHCGPAGSGYRMKLINQVMMAGALTGVAQGAAMARAAGLDAERVHTALSHGSASGWMFSAYVRKMIAADPQVGFTLGMLRKDLKLAREEALALGINAQLLDGLLERIEQACRQHGTQAGVQSLAWTA